jgi:hypothetical protein
MEINKKKIVSEASEPKKSKKSSKPAVPEIPVEGTPEYGEWAMKKRAERMAAGDAILSRDKAKRASKVEELRQKMVAAGRDPSKMKDVPIRELPWRLAVTTGEKPFMTLAKEPKQRFRKLMGKVFDAVTGAVRKTTTALGTNYDVSDYGGSTETRGEAIRLAAKNKKK